MLPKVIALLACLALQASATPFQLQKSFTPERFNDEDDGCPKGVHIVGIRGTLEDKGFGAMQPLVDELLKDIPDSDAFAIDYPAAGITIGDDKMPIYDPFKYILSVQEGRSKLAAELVDFNIFCPNTSVVVMGYSQGAHVAGDVLCGSTFPLFPVWNALEDEYKVKVKSVITLGDPRNNNTSPTHAGNSTQSGRFVRTKFRDCGSRVIDSWKTYCDANDTFCDSGKSIEAHLHYVTDYFDDIVSFIEASESLAPPPNFSTEVIAFAKSEDCLIGKHSGRGAMTSRTEKFQSSFVVETILVVGATGRIGLFTIIAAIRSGRRILAIVRNQASAEKLFQHVGSKEGITTVEADVLSEHGVKKVVDEVKAGRLSSFQHVYASVGAWNSTPRMQELTTASFRETMSTCLEANFFAYRATIPYLLEQGNKNSTWSLCTGGSGEFGVGGVTAISQGALFSMANAACLELAKTNVRFNEVYLACRVGYDTVAEENGNEDIIKASVFAKVYEDILANKEIKGCRVSIHGLQDVENLRYERKEVGWPW